MCYFLLSSSGIVLASDFESKIIRTTSRVSFKMKFTDICKIFFLETFFTCLDLKEVETFQFCSKSHPTPNSTVHFVNKHDLVSEVNGCIMQYLSFRCCMADYKAVRWFQQTKNGSWEDFLRHPIERELGEDDNQTAILKRPYDHGYDNGTYKCIGYGTRPGDTVEHSVVVTLKNCPDLKNSPPFPFIPDKNESRHSMKLSTNVSLICGAVFGTECNTLTEHSECTFRWEMNGKRRQKIPAGNSTSGLRVYYENSGTASSVNDLTSNLYIFHSVESDYGVYICTMENKFGKAERFMVVRRDVIQNLLDNKLVAGIVIAVFIILIVVTISWRFKWHLLIRWNELKHKLSRNHDGKLQHDILLLHTSSVTSDNSFARYCKRNMEQLGYSVIFADDITGGQNTISEWLKRSDESRCVVVILSSDFLTDEDETCRLPLRNIIRSKASFLFVLFRFTFEKLASTQMRDVKAAFHVKPKIRWVVNADTASLSGNGEIDWEMVEDTFADELDDFWKKLTSHLPQPFQTANEATLESEVSELLSSPDRGLATLENA